MSETLGHAELVDRSQFFSRPKLTREENFLGWRPDYRARGPMVVRDAAYGQYADFGVKASASAMSVMLLLKAEQPLEKVIFGLTTAILSAVTLASAFETF